MPDGPSRFAYVANSPLMYIDPTGEFLNFAIGVGIGIGLEYYFNPCATPADLLKAGALGAFGGGYVKGLQHANKLRKAAKFAKTDKFKKLSRSDQNSVKSLQKQINRHKQKKAEFEANPTVRPGMENLSKDIIKKQQERRKQHLEQEIKAFQKNINDIYDKY